MLKYNLHRAIKNILRFRGHHIIGITGLVLGISSVLVITAWVMQELRYDRFHDQSESIHMVTTDIINNQGEVNRFPETPPPLADALKEEIPSVEHSTHFVYLYGGRSLQSGQRVFRETGIAAPSTFFDVLSFGLKIGNPSSLDEPNTIFLTEGLADKIFPQQDPVGKTLLYKGDKSLTVRGIFDNVPQNSSLQFNYLVSYDLEGGNPEEWWQLSDATFIKKRENADSEVVKHLAQQVFRQHIPDDQYSLNMDSITDLRYKAEFSFFNAAHGSYQKLFLLVSVAILILIIACLNYTNLISAYAYKRRVEVMVRKVNGASARQLFYFFLTESIVASVIVWGLAVFVSEFFSYGFQLILDIEIARSYFIQSALLALPISLFLIGILSGLVPAMVASSRDAIKVKGKNTQTSFSSGRVRNAFILSQFVLSIALTIGCLVIWQQINFMESYQVGYEKENIIQVDLAGNQSENLQILKNELLSDPNIEKISLAGTSPVNLPPIFTTEDWQWEGLNENAHNSIYRMYADKDYADLFGLNLVEGQFFLPSGFNENKVVINETFAGLMGFSDPVGHTINYGENQYQIVGVLEDFNFQHLSNPIQPMAILYSNSRNHLFIKMRTMAEENLNEISEAIATFTGSPLVYSFISEEYDALYISENKIIQALFAFTLLTILLSCMGMIGMITFNIERRTKEIAIRKINGAKVSEVMLLLNKGILKWFILAFLISAPLVLVGADRWLDNFAFKVSLSGWIFFAGAAIVLVINMLTVSWQSWRAAIQNPVKSLRQE